MSQENNFIPSQDTYKPLTPFRLFVKSNFPFIENTYEALDNYGLYSKVVEYLNNVIENENTVESNVTALYNAFVSLNTYVSDYFDNLDVQEEINNKLDEMAETGVLQNIVNEYFDEINTLIQNQNTEIAALNSRVDNIIQLPQGSTTGDAELQDIRVAYNGITYPSAGSSVRNQVSSLNQKIENLEIVNVANGSTNERTKDIAINSSNLIKYNQELKLKIKNFSSNNGYVTYTIVYNNQELSTVSPQFIAPNETVEFTIPVYQLLKCDSIRIQNINTLNYLYYNITIPFFEIFKQLSKESYKITGAEQKKYIGYVKNDGTLALSTSGDNRFIIYENVKKGDVFKYSGSYGWSLVWGYYEDGTPISLLNGGTYENQIIEITDENIKYVIGWSEESIKELNFSYYSFNDLYNKTKNILSIPNLVVVAKLGGQFDNIQSAINFVQAMYDVSTTPVTIFIKNGVYELEPTSASYPYACINKGGNKISIIGESRDGVILRVTNTSTAQNKILDVGGECVIENLTLECLNDGTYTDENDLGHVCYCLHNDRYVETNKPYNTVIRNCKFYSECSSPIGAGLRNNQTQIYENVETISNSVITSPGSLYLHAPANSTEGNCSVIINNCNCQALDGKKALTLPDVSGSLPYTSIDTTIQRTICYSNGTKIIDDNFKTTHKLTNMSALNNINNLNK